MIAATPHSDAQRMDRHYRLQRHIYDATRTHYLIGRQKLIAKLQPADEQAVLEIGCGTAWNLARIARAYPRARLHGIDVSRAMLDTARLSLARQELADRISLRQGDATRFDAEELFGRRDFDRVFFSYALSMIPAWEQALAHACTMLAPAGELHIVDFGQCERLPAAFKSLLFAFLRHYAVTPRATLAASARRLAKQHGFDCDVSQFHRGYTDYIVIRRPPLATSLL